MGDEKKKVRGEFGHVDAATSGRVQRAFDMWLKDNEEIKAEIDVICERGGVKPTYPTWLFRVPDKDQFAAARRHAQTMVERTKRNAKRAAENKARMDVRRTGERQYIDGISKANCELTYMYLCDYIVALAFGASGKPNEMFVWFTVCTPEDACDNPRWKHESRRRLFERIEGDDEVHSFACLVQGQGKFDPVTRAQFIRRRFIEYVLMTSEGLPHILVKSIRSAEAMVFNFPEMWRSWLKATRGPSTEPVLPSGRHPRGVPRMREHNF